jgi:type I restriction enzyme M protein
MGWEIDVEAHATGIGAFSDALELKPAQGRQLLDCLKVRDENAPIVLNAKGVPEPDTDLRDNENVPLPAGPAAWETDLSARLATVPYRDSIDAYMGAEVLQYLSDAWVDHDKTKVGYEIPLTRHFYKYVPPRPLDEIDAEIKQLELEIQELLREVAE